MDAEAIKRQAQDENSSSEILAKLSKSKDKEILRLPQVRQILAQNINVPLNIVMSLCEDSNHKVQDEASLLLAMISTNCPI